MKFRRTLCLLWGALLIGSLYAPPLRAATVGPEPAVYEATPLPLGWMYLPVRKLDRDAMVRYAYDWSDKKRQYNNPAFRSFPNDCTNFVSQALRAGGWRDAGPSIPYYPRLKYEWWYVSVTPWNNLGQSWSWTEADSLFQFLNVSARADFTTNLSKLEPGDVVQADWTFDFHVDHTMIVTKKDRNDIYLTYHSGPDQGKPERDMPLSKIKKNNPKAVFYGFRLHDTL